MTAEQLRLDASNQRAAHWKRWGPYLSERAWGTVREDYSPDGDAWDYFPHDHARPAPIDGTRTAWRASATATRRICFALALWNGQDPILKERLFGLTGQRRQPRRGRQGVLLLPGQHADALVHEDTSTSIRSAAFPYDELVDENRRARPRASPSTSCSTPACSTRTATSTSSSSTRRPTPEDMLCRITVVQPRRPRPRRSTSCRRSGSATRGPGGATTAQTPPRLRRRPGDRRRRLDLSCRTARSARARCGRRQSAAAVRRERVEQNDGSSALRDRPLRQGRYQRLRRRTAGSMR